MMRTTLGSGVDGTLQHLRDTLGSDSTRERKCTKESALLFVTGLPSVLEVVDLVDSSDRARGAFEDEHMRTRGGFSGCQDPSGFAARGVLSPEDVASLRKKFKFLEDFSDNFIKNTPYESLLKTETTAIKLKEFEKGKAVSSRLSSNRDNLPSTFYSVCTGRDNRWTQLHAARFLPGIGGLSTKTWTRAREVLGTESAHPAISTYDMGSVGLGGFVSKKGWVELHDLGSDSLSLKLFNINSCGNKIQFSVQGVQQEAEFRDILELGEFKLALRVAREAMSFVYPWNKSISAIEGFMFQTDFCAKDLQGLDKPAQILTQFVDYVLGENADRWRAQEPFLQTGVLKAAWDAFFGSKPVSSLQKLKDNSKRPQTQHQNQHQTQNQSQNGQTGQTGFHRYPGFFDDICRLYNYGKCVKPAGTCTTSNGIPLRHVCNYRADIKNPANVCAQSHVRISNHK